MNSSPLFLALVLLVALASVFLTDPRPADAGEPITVTVNPAAPHELDEVSVTVAGDIGEQFCGLETLHFITADTNEIVIYLSSPAQFCDLSYRPTTFSVTEEIGLLPPGEYRAWAYSLQFDVVNGGELVTFEVTDLDSDGDGCTDGQEKGTDAALGGERDPDNPWDFYDIAIAGGVQGQDRQVDLFNDVVGVIDHYSPMGNLPYDVAFDRGPTAGPNPWNMTAPDGKIDLFNDIVGVITQFGHDCR